MRSGRARSTLKLVACVSNAAEAVSAAVERVPSVCVIDSDLPLGGLTAALEIGARLPTAGLVLRYGPDGEDDLFEALHAGVTAYLPRTAPSSRLLRAIVNVASGEAVLSGTQVARVLEAVRDPARARRRLEVGAAKISAAKCGLFGYSGDSKAAASTRSRPSAFAR